MGTRALFSTKIVPPIFTGGSSFSPSQISGLALWLDASDTSTITHSGGSVSQWDDKSGNGYHATQGTVPAQPATGSATLNSRNVIRFDGTDDRLTLPSGTYSIPNGDVTMFLVYRNTANNTNRQPVNAQDGGNNRFRFIRISGTSFGATHGDLSTAASSVATTSETTDGHIAMLVSPDNSTNLRVYREGNLLVGSNAPRGVFTATSFTVGSQTGSTNPWDGDIGEIIIYTRVLSSSEKNQVGNYLAGKWGASFTNF